jgi:ankyrin repeat protein
MERQDNRTRNNPVQTLLIGIFTLFIPLINYPATPEQTNQKHSLMLPLLVGTAIVAKILYTLSTKPTDKEALMQACYNNNLSAVKSLLQKGVDLGRDKQNSPFYGLSPLSLACARSNPEIVTALLNANANIHAEIYSDPTPFSIAVERDYKYPSDSCKENMLLLLAANANINSPGNNFHETPLIATATSMIKDQQYYHRPVNTSTVEFLLLHGADYTVYKNRDGFTAEELIKQFGKPGMRAALNQRKKDDKEKVSVELQGLFNEQHLVATTHGGILAAYYGLPNPD